ncbi:MAG: response regulator [Proteobacteria bacterium]|nr:response regulator [Pseudomonadota bacterium]
MRLIFLYCLFVSVFLNYVLELPAFGMNLAEVEGTKISKARRVIVAEDALATQKVYKHFLRAPLYELTLVENGTKLLEQYVLDQFDLIITDGNMPEMDGYEAVTKLVQKYGKLNLPPIIAITSNNSPEEMAQFFKAGADGFVPKPIVKHSLFAEINRFFVNADTRVAPITDDLTIIDRFNNLKLNSLSP